MPILLLLLVLLLLVFAAVLLWPLALWNRYRVGSSRRRPPYFLTRLNAFLIPASAGVFLLAMAATNLFVTHAFVYGAAGLLAGLLLGGLGWVLTRVEHRPGQVWYTPNRWLVLGLTLVVVARLGVAIWQTWERMRGHHDALAHWGLLGEHASLFAVAGLVLGYHAAYAWLLYRRLGRWLR
ncbi:MULTISPECIES: DUF1453 domain-containing protein [Luteimonas]|uniref:DUF1453 domain-containing protein n=1 Tax=Luteimonas TaxID=83614 RepID=UPI000C7AA86F|nr:MULTISPECIES: DUF1453 domain-containing protein [Luteimonas]